jgi:hypothetical protein
MTERVLKLVDDFTDVTYEVEDGIAWITAHRVEGAQAVAEY